MKRIKRAGAWLLIAAALALAGCGSAGNAMRQAVADGAITVAAGYRTLGEVDTQVQSRIRGQAKSDPRGAAVSLEVHNARYEIAKKALDAGAALVEAANAAIPLVDKGVAKEKSPAAWIADLAAMAVTVAKSLHDLGVF